MQKSLTLSGRGNPACRYRTVARPHNGSQELRRGRCLQPKSLRRALGLRRAPFGLDGPQHPPGSVVTVPGDSRGVPLGRAYSARPICHFAAPSRCCSPCPVLIPPYVTAVAWFTVLGSGGPLGRALAPEPQPRTCRRRYLEAVRLHRGSVHRLRAHRYLTYYRLPWERGPSAGGRRPAGQSLARGPPAHHAAL